MGADFITALSDLQRDQKHMRQIPNFSFHREFGLGLGSFPSSNAD